ncbi:MAG TPA: HYExAFE family protein [Pirellulales bacterium]|nr:HYExAFE family protein [Pirellulales bacterium]
MAKRDNHYEAAFEEFLRCHHIPYVAVDEKKRALLGNASLKSLDFIISTPRGASWLVDVKGRRFPAGEQKQYWKNWSTQDDVRSLTAWQSLFGPSFSGLFVFAYEVVGDRAPVPAAKLFERSGRLYGFVGITLSDYAVRAHRISAAWDTLAMPTREFRSAAAPVEEFFCPADPPPMAPEPAVSFFSAW